METAEKHSIHNSSAHVFVGWSDKIKNSHSTGGSLSTYLFDNTESVHSSLMSWNNFVLFLY